MDNPTPNQPEPEFEPQPVPEMESESYLKERIKQAFNRVKASFQRAKRTEDKPARQRTTAPVQPGPESEPRPVTDKEIESIVNERIKKAFDRGKLWLGNAKSYYDRSPRLQKTTYQGKYLPAFWTVACIVSLLVNAVLIAVLISFGHNFFNMKSAVAHGLVNGTSDNLALMDKAHIITSVSVQTKIQVQDDLPVAFSLPISQSTVLTLAEDTRISGAYIYLNNTPVLTDLTLPAQTPIRVNLDMNVPVDVTVPMSTTVPLSLQVPVDIPVDQTDLHQSIVGLQGVIEPYKTLLESSYNSPADFPICNYWWSGWMCSVFFGR